MIPKSLHPYLRDGWAPTVHQPPRVQNPVLPDVNPADDVVNRLRRKFGDTSSTALRGANGSDGAVGDRGTAGDIGGSGVNGSSGANGSNGTIAVLRDRISTLEEQVSTLEAMVNGAAIVCNGDGTITLTWGA